MDKLFKSVDKLCDRIIKNKTYKKIKDYVTFHPTFIMPSRNPPGSRTQGFRYPSPIDRSFKERPVVPREGSPYVGYNYHHELDRQQCRPEVINVIYNPDNKHIPSSYKAELKHMWNAGEAQHIQVIEWIVPKEGYIHSVKTKDDLAPFVKSITDKEFETLCKAHEPDHLPHEWWEKEAGSIVDDYISKGLPPVPGRAYPWKIPESRYNGKW